MSTAQLGLAQLGAVQLGAIDVGAAGFTLVPTATHVLGTLSLTATFTGTGTASGSNTFSVVSGPATAGAATNYVQVDGTHATFDINVTALSPTSITILESGTGTTQTVSAAVIPPTAPNAPIVATDNGNGTVSVSFAIPTDNGGAAILNYTVTWGDGSTAVGTSSPINVGVTNLVAHTGTVHATNSAGSSNESVASNSVTPNNLSVIAVLRTAPFLSSDTLASGTAAQAYDIVSGTLTANGSAVTPFTVADVTNGRAAVISVTPNQAGGGYHGIVRWKTQTASPLYIFDEHNLQDPLSTGASIAIVTKISTLPPGTDLSGTVGYQLFNSVGSAIGAHITTGIHLLSSISGADGCCADVTVPMGVNGFTGYMTWDNGASVYKDDELLVLPARDAGSGLASSAIINGSLIVRAA
jgi:hypothetical protein